MRIDPQFTILCIGSQAPPMADSPRPNEDDDDFELELEPIDPEILELERQRGGRKTEDAVAKIKFEEIDQAAPHSDYDVDWGKLRQFRFTTRHLLIVTAILALGLTLKVQLGWCMALFVMAVVGIGASWFAVYRAERREAAAREQRRQDFYAGRSDLPASVAIDPADLEPAPPPREEFRFAFSVKQMMVTMTAAAVLLAVLRFIDVKALTITLGAIALVGLVIQTFGLFEPAPAVVLAWWVLLVLYLILGLLTAFFPELMAPNSVSLGGDDRMLYYCLR
jgi:hypothetical protein